MSGNRRQRNDLSGKSPVGETSFKENDLSRKFCSNNSLQTIEAVK